MARSTGWRSSVAKRRGGWPAWSAFMSATAPMRRDGVAACRPARAAGRWRQPARERLPVLIQPRLQLRGERHRREPLVAARIDLPLHVPTFLAFAKAQHDIWQRRCRARCAELLSTRLLKFSSVHAEQVHVLGTSLTLDVGPPDAISICVDTVAGFAPLRIVPTALT